MARVRKEAVEVALCKKRQWPGVLEHELQPFQRVGRIEGHEGSACL